MFGRVPYSSTKTGGMIAGLTSKRDNYGIRSDTVKPRPVYYTWGCPRAHEHPARIAGPAPAPL